MRFNIQANGDDTITVCGETLHPTEPGESPHPIVPNRSGYSIDYITMEYVRTELLGPTILVKEGQGNTLYAINANRLGRGVYVLDDHGHTFVEDIRHA